MEEQTKSQKTEKGAGGSKMGFDLLSDDLIEKILGKLPAKSLASAACVSKLWHTNSNSVLSKPRLASAFSTNPSLQNAIEEVVDKVLSEPIRPHFAIANGIGRNFNLKRCFDILAGKFGARAPLIVTWPGGFMGRDAVTKDFREVMELFDDASEDDGDNQPSDLNSGILLTVGFLPGLKVDAIPFLGSEKSAGGSTVDNFVLDIRDFASSASGCTSPVGIIMFGDNDANLNSVIQKLDCAMEKETIIVGDEKTDFLYRSNRESRTRVARAVALVFAKDREKPHGIGEIQFHTAVSKGISAIGPRFKAASVRVRDGNTWLTARREGEQEIFDGQTILNIINNELENHVAVANPYMAIGVTELRKCCIGTEKSKLMSSLVFYALSGGDEEYLYVDGTGIRTADHFQFYHADPGVASTSCRNVSANLSNLKQNWSQCKRECLGGFIFSCCGRSESFFGASNVDSSPFLENFPSVPLAGIYCGGEIGRGTSILNANNEEEEENTCQHVFSSIYLVLSYAPIP